MPQLRRDEGDGPIQHCSGKRHVEMLSLCTKEGMAPQIFTAENGLILSPRL